MVWCFIWFIYCISTAFSEIIFSQQIKPKYRLYVIRNRIMLFKTCHEMIFMGGNSWCHSPSLVILIWQFKKNRMNSCFTGHDSRSVSSKWTLNRPLAPSQDLKSPIFPLRWVNIINPWQTTGVPSESQISSEETVNVFSSLMFPGVAIGPCTTHSPISSLYRRAWKYSHLCWYLILTHNTALWMIEDLIQPFWGASS